MPTDPVYSCYDVFLKEAVSLFSYFDDGTGMIFWKTFGGGSSDGTLTVTVDVNLFISVWTAWPLTDGFERFFNGYQFTSVAAAPYADRFTDFNWIVVE